MDLSGSEFSAGSAKLASDTQMSGESFPLTQVIWSLMYSSDFMPEPVTRQRLGLSDSDARTFLAFSAEAKARIRVH